MFDGIATGVQHMIDFGTITVNLAEEIAKDAGDPINEMAHLTALKDLSALIWVWRSEVANLGKDAVTWWDKRDWSGLPKLDAPKSRALLREFEKAHPELLKGVRLK